MSKNRRKSKPVQVATLSDPDLLAYIESMEHIDLGPDGNAAVQRLKQAVKAGKFQVATTPVHSVAG